MDAASFTFRRLFLIAILIFIAVFSGSPTLAGTTDPNTPDSQYVEFGKKFPFVRKIRARDAKVEPPKVVLWYASAVLIRPHWILTAAHVMEGAVEPVILGDEEKPTEYPLAHMVVHPLFAEDKTGHCDIALGYSEKDLGLDFYPELYTDTNELGQAVTLAGFGFHGTFHTGMTVTDNKRRAGSNRVTNLDRSVLVCDANRDHRTALEFLITPGDSGGGLFIGNKLAGIHSFLMAIDGKPNGTYTDESAHTRVSLYADWVESEIQKYEQSKSAPAKE